MMYKTHLATSIAAGVVVSKVLSFPFTIGYLSGVVIGSLLPDIDHPRSFIGRRFIVLSKAINKEFGHRGLTHSLIFWLILSVLLSAHINYFTLGVSFGYLFHIFGDFFSRSGVPLLLPYDKKRFKSFITYKTASFSELVIFYFSIFIGLFFILNNEIISPLIESSSDLMRNLLQIVISLLRK
ncbi:metal-dependent hydrolase [Sutcliffiella horikoshii]|uniref:Metal-dependent hydrolase n=1 Tax=Sutcliffiella horikoshii TaxID=79883 RepID=A0AA95B603_9BACI|nr:metal-dependent hydrolase [Sutcliffiella horikoshii]TYS58528.1 metal-dependent hydrolase [Sutcliffiella horikoshii]